MASDHFLLRLANPDSNRMTPDMVVAHVGWLHQLSDSGKLVLCGSCDDDTALILLRCTSLHEAESLAATDPFAACQAYGTRSVVEFSPATPKNNFLLK